MQSMQSHNVLQHKSQWEKKNPIGRWTKRNID